MSDASWGKKLTWAKLSQCLDQKWRSIKDILSQRDPSFRDLHGMREWKRRLSYLRPHLPVMPDIQAKSIQVDLSQPTLASSQLTSSGFSYLKQNLQHVFENSDQILISNLIENTKTVVSMATEDSRSYSERTNLIENIYREWLDLWGKYKDLPEAIDLITFINDFTDRLAGYYYLFISLALVNEGKTSDKANNRERVVQGFGFLAETIDVL